jgi:uncharacterized SAM-binding protein YcdF (DUF218 family)
MMEVYGGSWRSMATICRKHWKWITGIPTTLIFLVALAAYLFPQQFLYVQSSPAHADCIVVLGGDPGERVDRAAELFKQKAAPRIIVTGAGDCEGNKLLLIQRGVPEQAIELECNSKSTRENAQFTVPLLQACGAKSVILVTSWYHSRRALACFQKYSHATVFYSEPAIPPAGHSIRSDQRERKCVFQEYLKIAGYWMRYGVCPF